MHNLTPPNPPRPPYKPPELPVHHGHAPEPELPPPPKYYIHPDKLRAEELEREAIRQVGRQHPILNMSLGVLGLIPMAYATMRMLRTDDGWLFLIPIPPLVLVPFFIGSVIGMVLFFLASMATSVSAYFIPNKKEHWGNWFSGAAGVSIGCGVFAGYLFGILVWLLTK